MRLRNVKNADNIVRNSEYVINEPNKYKGNYNKVFKKFNILRNGRIRYKHKF